MLGCESFRYRCPPPHTTSGLGGVQDLGGLVRQRSSLERPVLHIICTRSPSSTPPTPSSHLCSGNRPCALLSAVFLCVVGVLCFAGVSLAFRYATLLLISHFIIFAVPWRARCCVRHGGCTLAFHFAGDAHFRCRLCARHCIARHCDACIGAEGCSSSADVVVCTDACVALRCAAQPSRPASEVSCRRRRASAVHPG